MSRPLLLVCLSLPTCLIARADERQLVTNSRLVLGTESVLSASARVADLDGNGHPDVVIANGRHWPGQNYVFFNHGRGRFTVQRPLGMDLSTSYAAEPGDFDGDGDVDLVVGNDGAPNRIFLNDGRGHFQDAGTFGGISSVRSLTVADVDLDGDPDILSTCRGMRNSIYLNDGAAHFTLGGSYGTERDSTIDVAIVDWDGDGHPDLALANRDNQSNALLLNDGRTGFDEVIPFGAADEQTRAVAVADMNGDSYPDLITGNIGGANRIYYSDGHGNTSAQAEFGYPDGNTYTIRTVDLNNDAAIDILVGNAPGKNAVYINQGDGRSFTRVEFGDAAAATYGVDSGDFDGDGYADVVVANSGSPNRIYLNRPAIAVSRREDSATSKPLPSRRIAGTEAITADIRWDPFGGVAAREVSVRTTWNADETVGPMDGVQWSVPVPGLGHSSPVIRGHRLFLTTAVAAAGDAPLQVGRGGQPDAADDNGEQSWLVLCYDRRNGELLWRQTARQAVPRATRHSKATHANSSVCVQEDRVVAFFGSEGIYCYDLDGQLLWSQDLGVVNISKYGIGWGYASSPAVHQDRIVVVCDDPDNPYLAALRLEDGTELWRTSRKDICERSWSTPLIHSSKDQTQIVVNGWPWILSYDLSTGDELWRIRGGGDNPVPTPFESNGLFYITNAHGAEAPIFVVRPEARGDVTPVAEASANDFVVWSTRRGGAYMSTPIVCGDYLYLGNTNGVLRCFHAGSGEKIYENRLGSGASVIASLVATDGKIFCASENGTVYVIKAGPKFELLARNRMDAPCFATPAIADDTLFIRTTKSLTAIR